MAEKLQEDKLVFRCYSAAEPSAPLFLKAFLPSEKHKYRRERAMNKRVPNHLWPHVVTMIDYGFEARPLAGADCFNFIIFPNVSHGTLLDLLLKFPRLSYETRWYLCASVFRNIIFLYTCGIAHLDLKVDNVMLYLDGMGQISTVLIDLDSSGSLYEPVERWCSTPMYAPPEVNLWVSTGSSFLPEKVDVFNFATLIFCILFNYPPFGEVSHNSEINNDQSYINLVKLGNKSFIEDKASQ